MSLLFFCAGDNGEVTATHLLLGIWAQKGSAGQLILAALGFNDQNAEELEGTVSVKLFSFEVNDASLKVNYLNEHFFDDFQLKQPTLIG